MTDPCEGKYDIVPRLRDHTNRDDNDIAEAAAYIERLRAERDEARREVCCFHHLTGFLAGDYAISRGWDCYENYVGEGFPQSVTDFKEFLKGQDQLWLDRVDRLTRERDDARALFCGLLEAYKRGDGREEAKKRGWFCFQENKNV